MAKLSKTCIWCGADFQIYPARQRDAEKHGMVVKFCSRLCTDAARKEGVIKGNPRTGAMVVCTTCGSEIYRKPKRLKRSTLHFCSESCRLKAISVNRIDRKFDQAREKKMTGVRFQCRICDSEKYQRKSYSTRGVNKTCGDPKCVSAYSRSLWSLPPYEDTIRCKPKISRRPTNFTAKQRTEWLGRSCAICDSSDNLCLDHIIPVCAGGQSVRDNAQTLCQPCNIWKMKHFDRPLAKAVNNSNQAASLVNRV